MRVEYFQNIKFEWDSQKASLNLRNHHLTFETACEAFFDPFIQLSPVEVVAGEEREAIIGMTSSWQLLYVVYTMRGEEIFRLISAREATKSERRRYEEQ